ncbi:MAG: hypothetical protein JSW64_00560 [Candidatus Zixiibacteriota bacterium]|nr:MAG: hypothetical protein JSW64_00560 [candidate division Zixibacteria bacterium]
MNTKKYKFRGPLISYSLVILVFLFAVQLAAADIPEFPVSFNGKFVPAFSDRDYRSISENALFYCRYDIGSAGDETRLLLNFNLYKEGSLLYSLDKAPGSDVYISNSGITAFMDHTFHYNGLLTVHFYSEAGDYLFSKGFTGASLFGFSPSGEMFGVGTAEYLFIMTPRIQKIEKYTGGFKFDISVNGDMVVIAGQNRLFVYRNGDLIKEIDTDVSYPRKIKISPGNNTISLIDKKRIFVYSIDGTLIFEDTLGEHLSFRDLKYHNENIVTGVHFRDDEYSKGIARIYNPTGENIYESQGESKDIKSPPPPENIGNLPLDYDPIPWPFAPFDSMCTVWNHYEQHMSDGTPYWSYLHQGLDLITPINEPTYAVESGIVKCVLTIGGGSYWRIAISPRQDPGWTSGWLYAHLVESSIQFDVGDTVNIYDYLGDIIYWSADWGHIHFVEITDSGLVWQYIDNEWGIDFNPLLALPSDEDIFPPIFDNVFPGQKFAFSPNQTDNQYLDPDSLTGDIDIIVKIRDYIGTSPWQQPAYELYYWVESIATGDTVYPRTLAQILNHSYDFYSSNAYEIYATLLYKRDSLLVPSFWMDTVRNYYHILTNNNGDSLGELWEKQLSFHTADYLDGPYRIFVEANDSYENSTLDSMDVFFQNGPNISFDPSPIIDTLFQGRTKNCYLTIWNNGTGDLTVELEAVEFNLADKSGDSDIQSDTKKGKVAEPPVILNNWLFVSPAADTVPPGDSLTVTVTLDATTVGEGNYIGEIDITSNDPDTPTGTVAVNLTVVASGPECDYVVGDANNSGAYDGLDITYSVNYFKGGPAPPYSCECTPGNIWYVGGDVNASCDYNGLDVTYGVAYFKGGPGPMPCPDCPPVELSPRTILTK